MDTIPLQQIQTFQVNHDLLTPKLIEVLLGS